MVKKTNAGIIILLMLVCCTCIAFCVSPTENNQQHQDRVSGTPETIPQTTLSDSGKPCKSNDEWHAKADQTGFWSGGILVEQSMSDEEIHTLLGYYHVPNPEKVKISGPRYIGYYISVNETRDQHLLEDLRSSQSGWNVSFSSPMFAFFSPETKIRGDTVEIPVFLIFSGQLNETMVFNNLLSRGIPLQKTKVVKLGYFSSSDISGKEQILNELNNDERVLFTFKEYLQGDIC
jgi:hypothetical protein